VSDREALLKMLNDATASEDWQTLEIRPRGQCVIVFTGPDDATAVFGFDESGSLKTVSVVEAYHVSDFPDCESPDTREGDHP
jgi:hypothetical protein